MQKSIDGTARRARRRRVVSSAVVLAAAALGAESAHGQVTGVWNTPVSGSWGDSTKWQGGVIPNNDSDTADFSQLNLTSDLTVTLDGDRTLGTLIFGDTSPGNNWVVNSGTGGQIQFLGNNGPLPSITVNAGTTATINTGITTSPLVDPNSPQDLFIQGAGTLVLNGPVTVRGAINVNAGTTQFKNLLLTQDVGGSGPGPTSLNIDPSATVRVTNTLTLQASQNTDTMIVNGGTIQLRNANSSLTNPSITYGVVPNSNADDGAFITSNVDLGNTGTQWFTGNGNNNQFSVHGGDLVFQGNLLGSANIAYSGKPFNGNPFSMVFEGDNSAWTGSLTIVEGSFVPFNTSGSSNLAIGGNNAVIFNAGAGQTAIMYLYGMDTTIGSLSGSGAGVMSIRNAEWTSDGSSVHNQLRDATLTVNQTTNGTYAGTLDDGPSDRAPANAVYFKLALNKSGPATLTLAGNNTYTGGTTVSQGTLEVAGAAGTNPLSTGPITVNSGGTLKFTQSNVFGNGLSVPSQSIAINGGTLTNNGSFNALGNVTLTGGTIAASAGPTPGQFEAFALNGTVASLASGTSSVLSGSGAGAGFHLSANTTFDVAQGTTSNGQDLVVSGSLTDQSAAQTGSRAGGLTKVGAGTLVLAGNNTYTGQTIVNAGKLMVTGSINSTAPLTVNAGTLAVGPAAVLKNGIIQIAPGATFDATQGAYTIGAGQALIAGHTSGTANDVAGNISVNGGILDPGGLSNAATLGFASNLGLSGGTLRLDLGANSDLIKVAGDLTLSGSNLLLGAPAAGHYTLFNYGGALTGGAANLGISGAPTGTTRQTFTFDTSTPGAIALNVSGNAASLVWAGGANSNAWDVNSTSNWKNGASPDKFFNLDNVTFDSTGSTTPDINISGTVSPASLTVNSAGNYTFSGSGSIGGSGGLTKSGTGSLTINTTNSFAGPVAINGGSVSVGSLADAGSPSALGAGTSVSIGNATLNYTGSGGSSNRSITLSDANSSINVSGAAATLGLSGAVGGAGGLTKTGAGTLALGGSNSYAGNTTVQGGTLAVASDASLGTAPTAAQANAITLAGGNLSFTGSTSLNANRGIALSSAASIDVGSNSVSINGPISGTVPAVTFSGNGGTIALNGTNTYNAATVISGPTVQVPSDFAFGPAAQLTVQNGGAVAFTADTTTDPGRNVTVGTLGGAFNSGGHAITLSGTISGPGALKLGGGGSFTLASPNTYTGGTTVDPAVGSLTLNSETALGTGPLTFQGATNLELPGLDGNVPNDISLSTTATFVHWETTNGNFPTLLGKITGGSSGLKAQWNLSDTNGGGGITLANPNNTFTVNEIDVNRGRIAVAATGALGNPNNLVFLDDTISGPGSSNAGFHFLAPNIHVPNPFQFNDYSNINVNGNNGEEISGNIVGPGGSRGQDYWVLGGTQDANGNSVGSLKLSGNNTFSQNVTIASDTLLIAGSPTGLGTGTITLQSGASLGFDASGVNTSAATNQSVSVSGDGIVNNFSTGRGALINLNGSNTYAAPISMQTDSTMNVVNAADTLTLAGDITTAGGNALTKIGAGTLALAGPSTSGVSLGALNVNGGTLKIGGATGAAGPLAVTGAITIASGAKVQLPAVGQRFTSSAGSLVINGSGALDVGKSAITVDETQTSSATLKQYIVTGYNGGAWNGSGVITSASAGGGAVGYTDAAEGVVSGLPANTFLIQYTRVGDLNLDGTVNFSDLLTLAQHYGQTGADWVKGDVNYDGTVGFGDLLGLAQNYNGTVSSAQLATFAPAFQADVQAAFAAVPEPGTLGLCAAAAGLLLARRRRA